MTATTTRSRADWAAAIAFGTVLLVPIAVTGQEPAPEPEVESSSIECDEVALRPCTGSEETVAVEQTEAEQRARLCAAGLLPRLACEAAADPASHPAPGEGLRRACAEGVAPAMFCGGSSPEKQTEDEIEGSNRRVCEEGLVARDLCESQDLEPDGEESESSGRSGPGDSDG